MNQAEGPGVFARTGSRDAGVSAGPALPVPRTYRVAAAHRVEFHSRASKESRCPFPADSLRKPQSFADAAAGRAEASS